jgi:hypothetical protein
VTRASVKRLTAKELTEALGGRWDALKRLGKARCPAHDDSNPSFDIEIGENGRVVFTCRAGCSNDAVLVALKDRGLWPRSHQASAKAGKARIVATYSYQVENGTEHFQVCRMQPKDFRQRHKGADGRWVWKLPEVQRFLPYRLPEVAEAIAAERPVFIVEGEKDADNLAKLGIAATCNAGGAGKWRPDHAQQLRNADAIICPDNDEAGRKHANRVWKTLRVSASRVRLLELPGLPPKGDVSDWLAAGGTAEALWTLVEAARDVSNVVPFDDRASVPPAKLEREKGGDDTPPHWAVEPWSEPVNGAALLDDIVKVISRYMVMPPHAAEAVALWVLHAWSFGAWHISPLLINVSPTPGCGKTTLLSILFFMVPRAELVSNTSASSIFRLIEDNRQAPPSFLLDEGDSYFLPENQELRGIVNSGWMKLAANVLRTEGEGSNRKARRFSTWAPKAIATIKRVADTLMDRGVVVKLQKKAPGRKVLRYGFRDSAELSELRSKAARWAADNAITLGSADPEIPDKLSNRPADNWRQLLAIADQVGGRWPDKARKAADSLTGFDKTDDAGVILLRDIRKAFEEADNRDWLGAEELQERLVRLDETPWAEWRRGEKPITTRGIAKLLEHFEISSDVSHRPRRYWRKDFEPVWAAYLPTGGNASG